MTDDLQASQSVENLQKRKKENWEGKPLDQPWDQPEIKWVLKREYPGLNMTF